MQIAIVGLARAGKTTVFNTLARGEAETGGFGGMTVNVGVVKVPDERLSRLTELFKPKREVPADVTYVDLPAPPTSADGREPAEIPADQLARLRNADALLHVVRAFDDPSVPHPEGSVEPARDLERLDLELVLADLAVVEKRAEKLRTSGRHGTAAEREQNERELEVLERLLPPLREGTPVRDVDLSADEQKLLRGFRLLTEKPVLVLLNIDEADIARAGELVSGVSAGYRHRATEFAALSARIEMEIGQLDDDEAEVFRADLGLSESGLERVIRLSYHLLGLISFFTAGPDETRAWTIPDGSTAVDAAGAIHSDLARGFIRAEVVGWQDLLALGSMAEARRHGKLRSEGKAYRVRDGDVIEVLFNV
ncbi:MAG TPA: redox-regulated ATPase YchF [Candidatus Caenarcaniphilales bacterium]|nr:redox-regulated ATPase YchF [Candidatus Caenarcaniphilales bacterium]